MTRSQAQTPMVKRLIMFRHGVAYVERSGPAAGRFEMSFKRSEMNDVLKSLAVWVAVGEARVGSVAFEAPEDPREALRERDLLFEPGGIASGLLRAGRGRRVALHVGPVDAVGTSPTTRLEGEILGIEETPGGDGPPRRQLVLRSANEVQLVDLQTVQRFSLLEEPSQADLAFYVDRSRAASSGISRSVLVELDGNASDLRIAYVIPAAIWRVSYRLVLDDSDDSVASDDANATSSALMAWAIVHNPVDEELNDVELTLTTGQPVSFVIDLYHAKRVQRAVVEETERAVAPPTKFERSRKLVRRRAAPPPPAAAPAMQAMEEPAATRVGAGFGGTAFADEGGAEAVERGELFEYRLSEPISLKRGGSAMVPLTTTKPKVRRERIWREGAGPHPDQVASFRNDSAMVLEEGPLVVYEGGGYAGESMLPYSPRGAEIKLAYAKDLAVSCRRQSKGKDRLVKVRLGDTALVQEVRHELNHTLRIDNDHGDPVTVIFELPKHHGRDLDPSGPKPAEVTASYWRFEVTAAGHDSHELVVRERWRRELHTDYTRLAASQLHSWLDDKYLDKALFDALSEVLSGWEKASKLDEDRNSAEQKRQAMFEKQTKISQQLAVLKDAGPEGELRLRYVGELAAAQDAINALELEITRLHTSAQHLRAEADRALAQLTQTAKADRGNAG